MLEKARSKAVRSVSPEPGAEGNRENVRGLAGVPLEIGLSFPSTVRTTDCREGV